MAAVLNADGNPFLFKELCNIFCFKTRYMLTMCRQLYIIHTIETQNKKRIDSDETPGATWLGFSGNESRTQTSRSFLEMEGIMKKNILWLAEKLLIIPKWIASLLMIVSMVIIIVLRT